MTSPEQTSALEQKIKSKLEQSLSELDDDTLQRLHHARRIALQQTKPWYKHWHIQSWLPSKNWLDQGSSVAGSFVTGFVLCSVFAMLIILPNQPAQTELPITLANLEMADLAEEDDVLTDPGFYLWLEESNQTAGADEHVEPAV